MTEKLQDKLILIRRLYIRIKGNLRYRTRSKHIRLIFCRIDTLKKIFTTETTVLESIVKNLLKEKEFLLQTIKELELTLKVPRMHFKFIE